MMLTNQNEVFQRDECDIATKYKSLYTYIYETFAKKKALKLPRYEQLHVCSSPIKRMCLHQASHAFRPITLHEFQLLEFDTDLLKHFSSLCILILGHVYSLQKLCEWKSQFLNILTLSGSPWQWERWDINKTIERLKVAAAAVRT